MRGNSSRLGSFIALCSVIAHWQGLKKRRSRVQVAYQSRCTLGSLQSCYDGFLARLSGDGQILRYATYLGGRANDSITALAVDEQGFAYVTGTYNDGALAALFDTLGHALTIDRAGNLYITGQTSSANFPAVNTPYPSQGPGSCQAIGGGTFPIGVRRTRSSECQASLIPSRAWRRRPGPYRRWPALEPRDVAHSLT
jgi:beta-propeller repeat-containing protein